MMQNVRSEAVSGNWGALSLAGGLLLALSATTAWAATDQEITDKVKSAIAADPVLSQRGINVSTYKGRVLLKGQVPYEREAEKAVGLANSVEDVRSVQNNLVGYLAPDPRTSEKDKEIVEKVKQALASDQTLSQRGIMVSAYNGRVQLKGKVENQREADRAVDLAKDVEETRAVQNDLVGYLPPVVFTTAGDKDATEKVKNALAADPVLSQRQIKVNTIQGRVYLTGQVPAQREAEQAAELAKNIEEVRSVQNDLTGYIIHH
jgi:hyperosmotically inducible protein